MTKKEALRDLQARLAGRLQSAQSEGVSVSWLAVKIGQGHFLLPLAQSGEIFSLVAMSPVPYSQKWFLGIVNLRGGLHGVVDMAGFLGEASARNRSDQSWAQARLVTFSAETELNCALLVDALIGLRRPDAFVRQEGAPSGSPEFFGQQWFDQQGTSWQEISLQTLANQSEFLNIVA
jgi:twitching motility protein PilI